MKLCIYEDATFDNFYPIACMRPVFELKAGATSLARKIRRAAGDPQTVYAVRELLEELCREKLGAPVNDRKSLDGDDVLFVNGRLVAMGMKIPLQGDEEVAMSGADVAWVRAKAASIKKAGGAKILDAVNALAASLPKKQVHAELVHHFWDFIELNPKAIADDFKAEGKSGVKGEVHPSAVIQGPPENLYIAPGARVEPLVVLDVRGGPITIEEGAVIGSFTRVEGPSYIGPKTQTFRAHVREGCSFGPVCRVGGEVEESIIHGYSNKYHDGFLGHAYVCEWVNLGAICTNSDLKNDYGTVQVYSKGEYLETNSTKIGSFIGDHVKTSIGTFLNTGTVIGILTNVVGIGSLLPKYIPANSLYVDGKITKGFGMTKSIETAKTAMGRRKMTMSAAEEKLIRAICEMTKEERNALVKKDRG
jgi:UDP-N-acetylglucosamine diphosphorylase / glucose-1-phosphate thymidylyltransferase / UDP-N-acetylgalactosamine diphosphorylase / glucosamine-1-phosphate N-acetyltransferase / galactosamine-1-phosphate N-acetyltransferase